MFIKKDTRKVPAILEDPEDSRESMYLARREAEFLGEVSILCDMSNIPQLQNLRVLSLYSNKISSLEGIGVLAATPLEELNLGYNQISSLPDEFASLRTLRSLWIEDNQFTRFPTPLLELKNLRTLRMSNNSVDAVPAELGELAELEVLALDNNALAALPPTIGSLQKLRSLIVRGNQLRLLPEEVGELANLKLLHASSNSIERIPDSIGALRGLEQIYLNSNKISSVPGCMANLTALKKISLANNMIRRLSPVLEELWVEKPATDESCTLIVELHGNPLGEEPEHEGMGAEMQEGGPVLAAGADMQDDENDDKLADDLFSGLGNGSSSEESPAKRTKASP